MSDYYGMSIDRYNFLMDDTNTHVYLTPDELDAGWHFCDEWDGLLIHPDSNEFQHCCCPYMKPLKTPERSAAYQQRKHEAENAMNRLSQLDEKLGLI